MRAIERLCNRPAQRATFRIIHNHRGPRDRLERYPLQTDCATERENRDRAGKATPHENEPSEAWTWVKIPNAPMVV